jgi:hypothetical protein
MLGVFLKDPAWGDMDGELKDMATPPVAGRLKDRAVD